MEKLLPHPCASVPIRGCYDLAAEIVRRYRAEAPEGFDPQNISFTVTPGKILSDTEVWTAAKFNLGFQPIITAAGTLGHTDLASGATWDVNATPGAWFYATGAGAAGVVSATKYTLAWGSNTPPGALSDGLEIAFKADIQNGSTVSIDLGSGGGSGAEKALKKYKNVDLSPGDIKAGQIVLCRYGSAEGVWQMLSQLGNSPAQYPNAGITGTRNLRVALNGTNRIDFSAQEIMMRSSDTGLYLSSTNVSITVDPSANGPNGLDVGSAATGWYYLWAFSDGTNNYGLCSLSATGPTNPTPTAAFYKCLLGAFRITGTGPIVIASLLQQDKEVSIADTNILNAKALTTGYALLAGGDATAFQTAIPPIARSVWGTMGDPTTIGTAMAIAGDTAGLGAVTCVIAVAAGTLNVNGFFGGVPFRVPINVAGPYDATRLVNIAVKSYDTGARNQLNVSGYSI